MSTTVEQIKERLSIADVVGGYIKLDRAGRNFRARCPFHNEKTPSFVVSPERGSYHCFGCNVGGDAFSFVEAIEGLDFKGALKVLADKAGVPLLYERGSGQDKDKKDRLYEIMEAATIFYMSQLSRNTPALAYLEGRGLAQRTIAEFRLGYAPDGWSNLCAYLRQKGYREAEMEEAGLARQGERGNAYDRFRSRIIFPLSDSSGRVIAFSGRIFPEPQAGDKEHAKYLNSPDTPLFDKSSALYGIDRAKLAARKLNCIIVVEGQMDLLMAHQSGWRNTVALSGTALTDGHCRLIKRFTANLILALDSDEAGVKASGRSALPALAAGLDVKAARLAGGKDPAELIRQNEELWKQAIREAAHIIEYHLAVLAGRDLDRRKFRIEAIKAVMPYLIRIVSPVDRAHFVEFIANQIGLAEQSVWEELQQSEFNDRKLTGYGGSASSSVAPVRPADERPPTRRAVLEREAAALVYWQGSVENPRLDLEQFRRKLGIMLDIEPGVWLSRYTADQERLIFEAESRYLTDTQFESEAEALLTSLEKELIRERYNDAVLTLREAEASSDAERVRSAALACSDLSKKLAG